MSLDGPALLVCTSVLVLAALIGAALVAPRTARTLRGLLARVGLQIGVSALVLLLAGVVLNDQYGFFSSWRDLLGNSGGQDVSRGGTTATGALAETAPGPGLAPVAPPDLTRPPLPEPGQRRQHFTVHGSRSGLHGTVLVQLPADYSSPGAATRTYPVIEVFQGYPGTPASWLDTAGLASTFDAMAQQHQLADAIVVSPQIEFPAGRDTECVDGGRGLPAVETWVGQDVPDFVVTRLRARSSRTSWATAGYSSGGYCAALTTMLHPDVFGSSIVLAGYFQPSFEPGYEPFTTRSLEAARDDLVALAGQQPPPVAIWDFASKADGLSYPTSRQFVRAARGPLSVTSVVDVDSGHRVAVWVSVLPQALRWLAATSRGFAPS
ncbi:alpha/beta hydrolase-fold protein [Dermatophilaceae bacterium Soc4.6]